MLIQCFLIAFLFIVEGTSKLGYPLKVICYFENWASRRPGNGRFGENEMVFAPCTFIIYSFATLNASTNKMEYDFTPTKIDALQRKGVGVMLAVGGAGDSSGDKYSRMAASQESRRVFVQSVVEVLDKYGFDGLDVDWEYPTCTSGVGDCGSLPQDKGNFVTLMRELRQALSGKLLTMATHPGQNIVNKAYDLAALKVVVDWINVMTYDLHGSWEKQANHHSPLYADDGGLSTDSAVRLYRNKGVPANKITIGIPTYGRSLRLAGTSSPSYGAAISGPGSKGPYTQEEGALSYMEICEKARNSGWKVTSGTVKVGPYAVGDGQLVGFDDVEMFQRKATYAKEKHLGGVAVWSLGSDDFINACGCGKYPLIRTLFCNSI